MYELSEFDKMQQEQGPRYPILDEARQDLFEQYGHERPVLAVAVAAKRILHDAVAPLVCKIVGHQPDEVGEGGPDSGYMLIRCHRCGATLHHARLY